jgi:hypothetical protein
VSVPREASSDNTRMLRIFHILTSKLAHKQSTSEVRRRVSEVKIDYDVRTEGDDGLES